MKNRLEKGFTLIELLVVIAIIGILSSVVLASLNTARSKAGDSAIKSNMANIRAQAEIFYDDPAAGNGTYTGVCGNANVIAQMNAANTAAGVAAAFSTTLTTPGSATQSVCHVAANGSAWAANVPLKTSSANSWCVDSTGASKQITAGFLGNGATVCP